MLTQKLMLKQLDIPKVTLLGEKQPMTLPSMYTEEMDLAGTIGAGITGDGIAGVGTVGVGTTGDGIVGDGTVGVGTTGDMVELSAEFTLHMLDFTVEGFIIHIGDLHTDTLTHTTEEEELTQIEL